MDTSCVTVSSEGSAVSSGGGEQLVTFKMGDVSSKGTVFWVAEEGAGPLRHVARSSTAFERPGAVLILANPEGRFTLGREAECVRMVLGS